MPTNDPIQTYNDKQISELSRHVFMRAMSKASAMLDDPTCSSERLHAIAAIADASACGFEPDDDEDELPF